MSILGWFTIAVGWLTMGTLLGMAKLAVFRNDAVDVPLYQRVLRGLLFPFALLNNWRERKKDDNLLVVDFVEDDRNKSYLRIYAILGPIMLLWFVFGLIGGPIIYTSRGVEWLFTAAGRLIEQGWNRITKRSTAKNAGTQTALVRLAELRDNELVKQGSHLLEQRDALNKQINRLHGDRDTIASKVEQMTAVNDQFVGAHRTTLARIKQLLSAKLQELTCADKALDAVTTTTARLSSIIELVGVNAYMDTIDPRTNDSTQQLLRDAYACVEACRVVISRAQSISIGVQVDSADVVDVDELARQMDAGWTADEQRIRENAKLLGRLAETSAEETATQTAPRLLN